MKNVYKLYRLYGHQVSFLGCSFDAVLEIIPICYKKMVHVIVQVLESTLYLRMRVLISEAPRSPGVSCELKLMGEGT